MFSVSNFYEQSKELQIQNDFQIAILHCADISTIVREITKLGTVAGLVCSASSAFFNFDPTFAITYTAVSGISWLVTGIGAKKLELKAQNMIQHFKELKNGKIF